MTTSPWLMRWLTSPVAASVRGIARRLVLRPFVWRHARVQVDGLEHLRQVHTPFVMVANHASDLDTAVIFDVLPRRLSRRLTTGAAADRFFTSLRRAALPSLLFNIFPVDRPGRSASTRHRGLSASLLDRGMSVLVYPQGSRWSTAARRFSTGPARMAAERDLPVLPVNISGTGEAWAPGQQRPAGGRHTVHVDFGRPLRALPGESVADFNARVRAAVLCEAPTPDADTDSTQARAA